MVLCTYFQQGNCRNGQRCRFEHVYASKYSYSSSSVAASGAVSDDKLAAQAAADAGELLRGGVWLLTGYSPFRDKPALPGLVDLSPEEVRLAGDQVAVSALRREARERYEQLQRPSPALVRTLRAIYNGESPPSPFQASGDSGSIFRSAAQSTASTSLGVFGMSTGTNVNPSSLGAPSNPSGLFGTSAATNMNLSPFGPRSNPPSVFGTSAGTNVNPSSFGPPSNPPGIFGTSAGTNVNPSSFGSSSNPPSAFGADLARSVFAAAASPPDRTVYSSPSELSPPELEQYRASDFTLGSIPELPPPRELCGAY